MTRLAASSLELLQAIPAMPAANASATIIITDI